MREAVRAFFSRLLGNVQIHPCHRNEWTTHTQWDAVLLGCCDCGLFHEYDFKVNERGHLMIRARRDSVATDLARQAREFPCRETGASHVPQTH